MEDGGWDLQAVVRGCRGHAKEAASVMAEPADPFSSSLPTMLTPEGSGEEPGRPLSFPELFAAQTAAIHQLEELYNPFSLESSPQQPLLLSPQRSPSSLPSASLLPSCGGGGAAATLMPQQQLPQPRHRLLPQTASGRSKRRKNQQKRVVCQVPAEGLSSDMWAWRKYGQKPIKGSPYPRGYYRCSSSKGCPARKQVERSRADQGTFIIAYTAEHNHPVPTHRNSLAGSTRQKFPHPSAAVDGSEPDKAAGGQVAPAPSGPLPSPTAAGLSPTTPLTSSSVEEELLPPRPDDAEVDPEVGEEDLLMGAAGSEALRDGGPRELRGYEGDAARSPGFGDGVPGRFGVTFPSPWMAGDRANMQRHKLAVHTSSPPTTTGTPPLSRQHSR